MNLAEAEERFRALEAQERLDRGLVASVNRGLSAVANAQTEMAASLQRMERKYDADRALRKKERAADRKELLRLASLPLGGLGFIISGQAGASTQPQLLTTLIVLVLAALFPELRDALLRRQSSGPEESLESTKPTATKRGNGLASDPPARQGH